MIHELFLWCCRPHGVLYVFLCNISSRNEEGTISCWTFRTHSFTFIRVYLASSRRISALGNSFLRRLLGIVLQVDAESICAFTTFVFSPYIRCRLANFFLVNFGAANRTNRSVWPLKWIATPLKRRPTPLKWRSIPLKWLPTPLKWRPTPLKWRGIPLKWTQTPLKWRPTPLKWRGTSWKWRPTLRWSEVERNDL